MVIIDMSGQRICDVYVVYRIVLRHKTARRIPYSFRTFTNLWKQSIRRSLLLYNAFTSWIALDTLEWHKYNIIYSFESHSLADWVIADSFVFILMNMPQKISLSVSLSLGRSFVRSLPFLVINTLSIRVHSIEVKKYERQNIPTFQPNGWIRI